MLHCSTSYIHLIHPPTFPHRHRRLQEDPAFVSTQTHAILARLLPDATTLRLTACHVDTTSAQITLRVRSTQARVPCPLCKPRHDILATSGNLS
jgi:hypothetical protein